MACSETPWDPAKLKKYSLKTTPVPRMSCYDPDADRLVAQDKPVVLTDTHLAQTALKWDLEYLANNLSNGTHTVFCSTGYSFKYYDDKKIRKVPNFRPPSEMKQLTFKQFLEKIYNPGKLKYYFQQPLSDNVGPAIFNDYLGFNWNWITEKQKKFKWGPLTSNLLLIGMPGVATPLHYDEQQNFFAQLKGYKRMLLFPPECFKNFYPYPVHHPHDRQSQVDIDNPDLKKFPKFAEAEGGEEAILGPGDVLFLPMYWWHHVESLIDSPVTVSINFWYKAAQIEKVEYPFSAQQKVAITRNIEKMLLDALQDPDQVATLLTEIVRGRFLVEKCKFLSKCYINCFITFESKFAA